MKNNGKKLEELVTKSSKEQGLVVVRLRDAGFQGAPVEGRRFTVRNICDMIIFGGGVMLLAEVKNCAGNSIPLSRLTQLADLEAYAGKEPGCKPGFLVKFSYTCWWIEADKIVKFFEGSSKKSFNSVDAASIGILVPEIVPAGKRTPRLDVLSILERYQ